MAVVDGGANDLPTYVRTAKYSHRQETRSRCYPDGFNSQSLSRWLLSLVHARHIDVDMKRALYNIIVQIADKLELRSALPQAKLICFRAIVADRAGVCRDMRKVPEAEGKDVLSAVAGGQDPPLALEGNAFVVSLFLYETFLKEDRQWPSNTALHFFCTPVEDQCLEAAEQSILEAELEGTVQHMSLHFDGLLLGNKTCPTEELLISTIEQGESNRTGFELPFAMKRNVYFLQALETGGNTQMQAWNCGSAELARDGTCIPALKAFHTKDQEQAVSDLNGMPLPGEVKTRRYGAWVSNSWSLQVVDQLPKDAGDYVIHVPNGLHPPLPTAADTTRWRDAYHRLHIHEAIYPEPGRV